MEDCQATSETGTEVLLYQEVDVWHVGDYAHAVLGNRPEWVSVVRTPYVGGIRGLLQKVKSNRKAPLVPERSERLAIVHQHLGVEAYPG
jgi:hypothetical protein